jgi:bifunctional non-homologous end joining protein LigD/DNA ligase-1
LSREVPTNPAAQIELGMVDDGRHHLFEIKWDGIRCLAFVENGQIRLQSRDLIDITAQFPELAGVAQPPDGIVLDGELVAMEENRPSLAKIQGRALLQDRHRIEFMSQSSPVVYVVFDLVYMRGESIMAKPLLGTAAGTGAAHFRGAIRSGHLV